MKIKYLSIFILSLSVFVGQSVGQNDKSRKIDRPTKNSVYIKFEKIEIKKVSYDEFLAPFVVLRLYNNSNHKIYLQAHSGDRDSISLFYEILNNNNEIIERNVCTVCSVISVGTGRFVRFKIQASEFTGSTKMRVSYLLRWENPPKSEVEDSRNFVYWETKSVVK